MYAISRGGHSIWFGFIQIVRNKWFKKCELNWIMPNPRCSYKSTTKMTYRKYYKNWELFLFEKNFENL